MLKRTLVAAFLTTSAACSPPASQDAREAPQPAPQQEIACNTLTPDVSKQVAVTDAPVAAAGVDLRGGRIAPGLYDLTSAQRVGDATGWQGTRAVAIEITEDAQTGAVTLNWAGTTPTSLVDRWTATITETPEGALTYACGRMGDVPADFAAAERTLELRLTDGANGALHLTFARR